jgi:hypothetical protein
MPHLFHLCVVFMAAAFLALLLGVLPFRRHALLYFVLGQAFVYCFLAPTYSIHLQQAVGTETGSWYLYLQAACLLVFLPPLVLIYAFALRTLGRRGDNRRLSLNVKQIPVLSMFSLASATAYVAALIYYGLLFRSVGHSSLSSQYLNLPLPAFFFIRAYDRLLLSLVILNYLAFLHCRPGPQKYQCWLGFLATLGAQVLVAVLNSRLQLVTTFVLLGSISLLSRARRKTSWSSVGWRALAAGMVLLGMNFTINVREHWQGSLLETVRPALLFRSAIGSSAQEHLDAIAARLDGIDLMAQMGPELSQQGFSCGESWKPGLLATVGYLWDGQRARDIKAELATNPKTSLMYDYAGINRPDYPSCILTDAYGNFGLLGIMGAALMLGVTCAVARGYAVGASSRLQLIVGIVALQIAAHFEGSLLFHVLVGWVQYGPSIVVLYAICPFRKLTTARAADCRGARLLSINVPAGRGRYSQTNA